MLPFIAQKTVCSDASLPLPVAVWGSRQGGIFTPTGCLPMDRAAGKHSEPSPSLLPAATTGMRSVSLFPAANCLIRFPDLPFDDVDQIRQALPLALEPLLPVAAASCRHRFLHTGLALRPLLSFSAENSRIETHSAATPGAVGRGRQAIYPRPLPLARAIAQAAQAPENCILLDAGFNHCCLVVLCRRRVVFFRTLPVFSVEEEKSLGLELTAHLDGAPLPAAMNVLIASRMESLAGAVLQTLRLFSAGAGIPFSPTQVFLSGALALFAASGENLAQNLPFKVTTLDLCRLLGLPLPAPLVKSWRPPLHDACLAPLLPAVFCRDLDLAATSQYKIPAWFSQPLPIRRRLALLAAIVALYAAIFLTLDIRTLMRHNALAADRIDSLYRSSFPGEKRLVDPLRQMEAHLARQSQKGDLGPLPRPFFVLDCLGEIARHGDADDIRLERLSADEEGVVMNGVAGDRRVVERLRTSLGNSSLLRPDQIQQHRRLNGGIDFEFSLRTR